ncbi:hypothetical protein [Sphingobium nicotianae]|uniref:Uncharacterized protein n=1 Tax=Sphingobium nicotianae TaxID=2782607 RepID=A0A9X1IR59_9SPHN|nr:hypothetical protein [Sphingobium nicotianae]MBT2187213.1 hypothetical protein [Sphingobium nicotianae]
MTKSEAEKAIRYMATKWARAAGVVKGQRDMPDFDEFVSWARSEGYGHYFDFRSTIGAMEDAERWFDEELGQAWRN